MSSGIEENLEAAALFVLLKKLTMPINQTQAYKFGLIDLNGKIIKLPSNQDEIDALSPMDRFCFKLKRMLGTKTSSLNNFLYLLAMKNDYITNIAINQNVKDKVDLKRILKDLNRMGD